MISFIVTASDDAEALARMLSQLVPAAADGLVREAAVIGARGATAEVAEEAGADLYEAFGPAFERARGPWVASAPLGTIFAPDWMAIVADHIRRDPASPARLASRSFSLSPREGWLAPKRLVASAVVVEQDLQRVARRGGALRILDSRRTRR